MKQAMSNLKNNGSSVVAIVGIISATLIVLALIGIYFFVWRQNTDVKSDKVEDNKVNLGQQNNKNVSLNDIVEDENNNLSREQLENTSMENSLSNKHSNSSLKNSIQNDVMNDIVYVDQQYGFKLYMPQKWYDYKTIKGSKGKQKDIIRILLPSSVNGPGADLINGQRYWEAMRILIWEPSVWLKEYKANKCDVQQTPLCPTPVYLKGSKYYYSYAFPQGGPLGDDSFLKKIDMFSIENIKKYSSQDDLFEHYFKLQLIDN